MVRQPPTRKCQQCKTVFVPDPRCVKRQRYCSTPECRQASKAASQQRWRQKPANRDSFTGPTQVERVRAWRQGVASGSSRLMRYKMSQRHNPFQTNPFATISRTVRYKMRYSANPRC